jgi:hypothetical protein
MQRLIPGRRAGRCRLIHVTKMTRRHIVAGNYKVWLALIDRSPQ